MSQLIRTATHTATIDFTRADPERRTVPASLSSEYPVKRDDVYEVLSHEPSAVNLERAKDGLPLLWMHDGTSTPVGICEGARVEGRRLLATLRFGTSPKAEEVWRDVRAGILKYLSVGYRVDKREPSNNGYTAVRWTPYECSLVAMPADPSVGISRSLSPGATNMTTTTVTADQVRELMGHQKLPDAFVERLVARRLSLDHARYEVLNELARLDESYGGHGQSNLSPNHTGAPSGERSLMVDAIAARMRGTSAKDGNPYRNSRVVDLARELLERSGVRTSGMEPSRLLERAGMHSSSDFPALLTESGNRVLRDSYQSYQGGLKRAFKPSTARDFRAKQLLMLGEAPTLQQVNEHGEFTYASMAEQKSSYSLKTYGRIVALTRQALLNDDLDSFGQMTAKMGIAAAEFEATTLVSLLTSNPTMSDSIALFHASHANLSTGAGSALQVSSLTAARKAMRLQKGLDGTTVIDAQPKYLIVPAALETTAEQLLAGLTPSTVSEVNPFAGKLDLIVDPRLDANSVTAWYLATDANLVDTIEYSYLDSAGGPEIMMSTGWEVDGTEFKVRLDFGCGVIDWRGLYKANGA